MSTAPIPDRGDRTDSAARVAKLFERHGRMVYGVCRAMLRDPHDAEDATQQAFLSAYRALLGGARVRDEGAWMATIARNECRARITAAMRTPLPLADEDLAAIPAPDDEVERRVQVDELRNAFAELPARQREAVVLRDLYGLRYGEVATALGLSRAATEALLFRARRTMRHRLRPAVATTLAVPLAVQEGLAQAIPGFAAAGSGAAFAGVAGGGLLAKLTAGPVGVKIATAAVAVSTVGAVGAVESERAGRDRAERPTIVTTVSFGADESDDSSGHGRSGRDDASRDDDDGRSGAGDDDRDGVSGSGSGSGSGSSGDDGGTSSGKGDDDASSGPGPASRDPSDDGNSGPGSGSDDGGVIDDGTADPADPTDDSGPSGSSGPGSGEDPASEDASGSGSGSSGSSGSGGDDSSGSSSSGSSSSGSGVSGSGNDDPDD